MEKLLIDTSVYVIGSLLHNWLPLALAILTAAVMIVYVDPDKLKKQLLRKSNASIPASVAVGAFTPLCACGTMAVIIGMLTTALPWGPIMAFLTSSPLMSPDGFILVAGIINFKFAFALAAASIIIGVGSGYLTNMIEKKTNFLKDQVRFSKQQFTERNSPVKRECGCSSPEPAAVVNTCGCPEKIIVPLKICCEPDLKTEGTISNLQLCCVIPDSSFNYEKTKYYNFMVLPIADAISEKFSSIWNKIKWKEIIAVIINTGVKQILLYYSIFVAIGFMINHFVPDSIIIALFSAENIFAVPLAALIGLPLYVNGESAIPLIKSLMEGGASGGAMLAFLITGPGTSAGVIAGISAILKKRAIALYIMYLLLGGIFLGYLYDLFLFL